MSNFKKYLDNVQQTRYSEAIESSSAPNEQQATIVNNYVKNVEKKINDLKKELNDSLTKVSNDLKKYPMAGGTVESLKIELARVELFNKEINTVLEEL